MAEPTPPPEQKTPQPPKTHWRAPSFVELYANNINFETSVWDLNIIFSVLDQSPDTPPFKQIGAVHVSWAQAKIMAYFMCMNVIFQETSNEPIHIPPSFVPTDIDKFIAEQFPNDAKAKAMGERINRLRKELGL